MPNPTDFCENREEMQDMRTWLGKTLTSLSGRVQRPPAAQVRCVQQGWGTIQSGRSVTESPLCLNGRRYESGIGTHAESKIVITLSGPGQRLTGLAGMDDNPYTREHAESLVFAIEAGGREIWRSPDQRTDRPPAVIDVDLAGQAEFVLRVIGPTAAGHADWVNLKATLQDDSDVVIGAAGDSPGLSFTYGGQSSDRCMPQWPLRKEDPPAGDGFRVRRLIWSDPVTGLEVLAEFKEYTQFPVAEWVVWFRNAGAEDTLILEDIRSLDVLLPACGGFLNYHTGDRRTADSYEPHRVPLTFDADRTFAPDGGRPTNGAFPYYNVEFPGQRGGAIVAIGWPGQWFAHFTGEIDQIRLVGGQERTRFKLRPGEVIRTPLSVLMFWRGDRVRAQNLWRRWMLAHNTPHLDGKVPSPILSCSDFPFTGKVGEDDERRSLDRLTREKVHLDYWWIDAGWYPCEPDWEQTGTWSPDLLLYPNGLRAVSDLVHQRGTKLMVWFEPERVAHGTWLFEQHPEWLLRRNSILGRQDSGRQNHRLLNLGDPAARQWLTDHVDRFLTEQGIDLYRQDFNINPLLYWKENDAPDRQGITENLYVQGYLAYWDELRRRHPGMLIDSCASGGRRNDLETLRRGMPLGNRSDFFTPSDGDLNYASGNQGQTYGLSSWVPFQGTFIVYPKPARKQDLTMRVAVSAHHLEYGWIAIGTTPIGISTGNW